MKKIVLNFGNKKKKININECKGICKFSGLMFKKERAEPLLFIFPKPVSESIHSFFCPNFLTVWLDDKNNIIDHKLIKKKGVFKPKKRFSKLIEIPINKRYNKLAKEIMLLLEKRKV